MREEFGVPPQPLCPSLSSLFCLPPWPICVSQTLPPLPLFFSPVSPSLSLLPPCWPLLFTAICGGGGGVTEGGGDGGPVSCFLCPSVCLDSVGMRVRKSCRRVQVEPQSVCVWRRGHTWCGSIHRTCSWELNCSGKFVLVSFIFLLVFFLV